MAAAKRFVLAVATAFLIIASFYVSLLSLPSVLLDGIVQDPIRSLSAPERTDTEHSPNITSTAVHQPRPWKWEGLAKDSCTYVEDICHSSHRWFYRTNPNKVQPNVTLMMRHKFQRNQETAYRAEYQFEHVSGNISNTCIESPISNHLVLFSLYSEMLGEFYVRGLSFLWLLFQEVDWLKSSQLYLHLYKPYRTLLDSHHIFTSPFRSHPLLDFTTLLDETPCTCLPRLVMCGYVQSDSANSTDGTVQMQLEPDPAVQGPPLLGQGTQNYRHFRNALLQAMIYDNAHVKDDIRWYRQQIFVANGVDPTQTNGWRVIGLSQRKGRRKWLNLDHVMVATRTLAIQNKLVLVEMNVEDKTSTSYQQIVRHGAMDALIGIHGAQLTEAVWMKQGSWVIELLPYVPDGIIMGTWTRETVKPTPLGVIFENTDLNHAGYVLPRESAPYCYDQEDNLDCWRTSGHPWDDRDFQLDAAAFEAILATYLIPHNQTHATECRDLVDRAGDDFVLYNVNCVEDATQGLNMTLVKPHHYYRTMTKKLRQPGEKVATAAV